MSEFLYKYNTRVFFIKFIVLSMILFTVYLFLPYYLYPVFLDDIGFYDQYVASDSQLKLAIISMILLLLILPMVIYYLKSINLNFLKIKRYREANRIISNVTVFLYIVSRLPLIYFKLVNLSLGRDGALLEVAYLLYNPYLSFLFSVALVSSVVEIYYGNKRNIILLFLLGLVPEIILGARANMFRFVFLLAIIIPWNFKRVAAIIALFSFVGFSRYLFSRYSASSDYDLVVLFFGDMINIFLGQSLLLNANITEACGIDGLHFIRAFTFPLIRPYLGSFFPDIANLCMNDAGLIGMGGSPISDLILAPISVLTSSMLLMLTLLIARHSSFNKLMSLFLVLVLVSIFPYFLRNGYIASVNHLVTLFIWILIPIFLLVKLHLDQKFGRG